MILVNRIRTANSVHRRRDRTEANQTRAQHLSDFCLVLN